jgi:hypothetical protein
VANPGKILLQVVTKAPLFFLHCSAGKTAERLVYRLALAREKKAIRIKLLKSFETGPGKQVIAGTINC